MGGKVGRVVAGIATGGTSEGYFQAAKLMGAPAAPGVQRVPGAPSLDDAAAAAEEARRKSAAGGFASTLLTSSALGESEEPSKKRFLGA
jgi:hypothetical protein